MGSYKIISEVSNLLHKTLWDGFKDDNELTQHVPGEDAIVLLNPADAANNQDLRLSVWLYQVQENGFMRNQPPSRVPQQDEMVRYPPLTLNLYYLLTPSTKSMAGDQMVLGRSMQILHDNAILLLETKRNRAPARSCT